MPANPTVTDEPKPVEVLVREITAWWRTLTADELAILGEFNLSWDRVKGQRLLDLVNGRTA